MIPIPQFKSLRIIKYLLWVAFYVLIARFYLQAYSFARYWYSAPLCFGVHGDVKGVFTS